MVGGISISSSAAAALASSNRSLWLLWLAPLILVLLGSAFAQTDTPKGTELVVSDQPQLHPVFFSEYKLRSTIEAVNLELRELKRNFAQHITEIYLELKNEITDFPVRGDPVALSISLMGAEFADLLIKQHIVQRRLLAGLKRAFVRFLPLRTLRRLVEKFPENYGWLRHTSQVELRPRFPGAKESQFVKLYSIIELRARARAADDLLTLTASNMRRILDAAHWQLVRGPDDPQVSGEELSVLSHHANRMMDYYLEHLVDWAGQVRQNYENKLASVGRLAALAGGQAQLLEFVDKVINNEALDIDLSKAATRLDMPLTINEEMVDHLELKWIPRRILESLNTDRRVLLRHHQLIRPLLEPVDSSLDLVTRCSNLSSFICGRTPF